MPNRGLLELSAATGDDRADETLRALVTACEAAFPGRVRNYLLSGSYAGGDATPESDLDIGVLFQGTVSDDERRHTVDLVMNLETSHARAAS